jgi:hypothetical protein
VKFLGAHVLQTGSAARALHRIGYDHASLRRRRDEWCSLPPTKLHPDRRQLGTNEL